MRRILLTFLLFFASIPVLALDHDLVVSVQEDTIWTYDLASGELFEVGQLTADWQNAVLSPTGKFLAYQVFPEVFAEEYARDCPCGGGQLPIDIIVFNTLTGETIVAGGQPDDVAMSQGITRSVPVWSPDGTQLAWTEGLEYSQLVIYDLATDSLSVIAEDIPSQTLNSSTAQITSWTNSGLLVELIEFDFSDFSRETVGFVIYAPDGRVVRAVPPQFVNPDRFLMIINNGNEQLAVQDDGNWQFIDVNSGDFVYINNGRFAEVSIAAWETSLRIMAPVIEQETNIYNFQVQTPAGDVVGTYSGNIYPSLLPSGNGLVYRESQQIVVWHGDDETYTLDVSSFGYNLMTFYPPHMTVLVPTQEALITRSNCAGTTLDNRLRIFAPAYVLGDQPNNVRDTPELSGELVGQINGGEIFTVINGPTCNNNIAWWLVNYGDGNEDWTAEGASNEYFVQPGCPDDNCSRAGG